MKKFRRILITVCTLLMVFGTTAVAATTMPMPEKARIKSFAVKADNATKNATKYTVYSNGENPTIKVTYQWDEVTVTTTNDADGTTTSVKTKTTPTIPRVTSANRGIVNVESTLKVDNKGTGDPVGNPKTKTTKKNGITTTTTTQTYSAVGELKYTPVANGTVKVTIAENTTESKKKSTTVTFTVKTYAEKADIVFGSNVEPVSGDRPDDLRMEIAKGSSLNLNAKITNSAVSNKKLTYEVVSVIVSDKKVADLDSVDKTDKNEVKAANNTIKKYATVDKNGKVTLKADSKTPELGAFRVNVRVSAADGSGACKDVTVNTMPADSNVLVTLIPDTQDKKAAEGLLNKSNVLTMKTNQFSKGHTYQLNYTAKVDKKDCKDQIVWTSANPAVATVDAKGKITAVGNGKTTITASNRYGAKLKKAVKLTVNVTTDVEAITVAGKNFEILANGKDTAKIAGAVNAGSSDKGVQYEVRTITADEFEYNYLTDKSDKGKTKLIGQYVSVDKKGNVKIKKPCTVEVGVYATKFKDVDTKVTVKGIPYVKTIEVAGTKSGESAEVIDTSDKAKKKVTLYRTGAGADKAEQLELTAVLLDGNKESVSAEENLTYTSSNNKVAKVEYKGAESQLASWKVCPVGNGTATITAKDTKSGAKTSFTVTVKTDAYEIKVAKAQDVNGVKNVYVKAGTKATTTYNLAKEIGATTNTDASVKNVEYYIPDETKSQSKVTLKAEESKLVTVKTKDTRQHGNSDLAENKVEYVVNLVCVANEKIAAGTDYDIDVNTEDKLLKVGDKEQVEATLKASDNKVVLNPTELTYTSSNAKVAAVAKDGTITAKKSGVAAITVAHKTGKTTDVSKTITVVVGRKDADVQKQMNNTITASLKAENRDYTGVHTTFDAKTNTFKLSIIDPDKKLVEIRETGMVAALKDLWKSNEASNNMLIPDEARIEHIGGNEYARVERKADNITVTANIGNGEETRTYSIFEYDQAIDDAIAYVTANYDYKNVSLEETNGYDLSIALTLHENVSGTVNGKAETESNPIVKAPIGYETTYTVNVEMDDKIYKQQMDKKIDAAIAELTSLKIAGIDSITYDADKNSASILASDVDQSIKETDATYRADVVNVFTNSKVLDDVLAVSLSLTSPKGEYSVERENADGTFDLNALLTDYFAKLDSRNAMTMNADDKIENFADLDGSVITADVTYQVGSNTYSQTYTARFALSENAFENAADEAIANVLQEAIEDGNFSFANDVTYLPASNELTVEFKAAERDSKIFELNTTGITDVLNAMINRSGVDRTAKVIVIRDGKATHADVSDENKAASAVLTGVVGESVTVKELVDNGDAIIKVTYTSGVSSKVLSYTIHFELEETAVDPDATTTTALDADDALVEDIEEPVADEETPEEDDEFIDETPVDDEEPADGEDQTDNNDPADAEEPEDGNTPAEGEEDAEGDDADKDEDSDEGETPVADEEDAEEAPAQEEAPAAEEAPVQDDVVTQDADVTANVTE